MVNYKTFTKALTLFCLLVFAYTIIPQKYNLIVPILKYTVIIFVVVILMMYNRILSISHGNEVQLQTKPDFDIVDDDDSLKGQIFKKKFNFLAETVLSLTSTISLNCSSAIYIIDPEKQSFILQTENDNKFLESIVVSNPLVNKFNQKDKKLYQKDNPEKWNDIFCHQNWRGSECAIFCPINLSDNTVGFIVSMVDHFTDINKKEQKFHNELGSLVSFGINTLGALEERMISEKNKSLILDILSNIDFKSDNQVIYNKFKFLIVSLFKYDRLTISIKKESENRREYDKGLNLIIKVTDGDKDLYTEGTDFPTNGSLHGLPVIKGESITTSNWQEAYNNLFRFSSSETNENLYKSILGVSIIVNQENKGSIFLERRSKLNFSKTDESNLTLIARTLGSALHWKNEYEKIYIDATHDGLSGLLNHQTFKERFQDEVKRAERFQHKMAIMIFDLDKFKKVNDTLGHQYGDYVIQTVSKIMLDNVRAVDVVARYGGEEFAIILINTTAAMSNVVAKRIVSNIADYNFSMDNIETRITISGGMSEYPTHTKKMKELIEFADQAMYETKQNGGNDITIHNSQQVSS